MALPLHARCVASSAQPPDPLGPVRGELDEIVERLTEGLAAASALSERLDALLVPEPPFFARDGGFIAKGAHAALDDVRSLRDESRRVIAQLEARYRQDTGINSLRIKHNAVLGYFIEVTATQRRQADRAEPLPPSPDGRLRRALRQR